jgi:hypothetical protein
VGERYEPEYAWAVAWSNGNPRPFIMVQHVAARRNDAIARFIANWQYDKSEPVMKSWRRAYREGARCIRVKIETAFGYATPTGEASDV